MKKFYSVVLGMILLICFSSVAAAKGNSTQEISTYYNGSYQLAAYKSIIVNNSTTYVPLKLIDNFSDISVTYGSPITVKTGKGTFKIDKRNTIVYNNTTYITFKKLQEMSHVTGKYIGSTKTLFLWDQAAGKAESDRLITNISKLTNIYREQFGQKIYDLSNNRAGWIVDIEMDSYGAELKILHKDYSTSELGVGSALNNQYILDSHLQLVKNVFENKYVWLDKTELYIKDLKNIEKLFVQSVSLKNSNLRMQVKRQNGSNYTISIPITDNWYDSIDNKFYFSNPKSQYKWSTKVWDDISKQIIRTGMNSTQVIYSWGYPQDVNSSNTSYSKWEQWIYGDTYIYFSNDILVSINEH